MISGLQLHLSRRELNALTLVLVLAVIPLFFRLQWGITLYFIACVALRFLLNLRHNPFPNRWLVFIIMLIGLVNFFVHYPIPFFRSAAVALLISMLGVKLLEIRRRRDLYVVVFLGYFALVIQFLYRQEMALGLYALGVMIALTAILVESSRNQPSDTLWTPLQQSARLLFQALPVMLILFLFFPRLSGPLWNLGVQERSATTGLSDTIRPGSISALSQSPEVAFRVHFKGAIPPPRERYWRGPVFWDSDGVEWGLGRPMPLRPLQISGGETRYHYSVILEPSGQRWLFALDLPDSIPPETEVTPDFQLLYRQPILKRFNYEISSRPVYNTGDLFEDEWLRALELPDNITPRMLALVEQWQGEAQDHAGVVDRALDYFRQEAFYYTLNPPLVERNPADQFLFDTRRGFCEHYATSFTLLMRIAGIPSRVVTGYQGGEINPLGDYLMVRQSDAHAWSEVWLEGRGWVRIDPTAAVAPERIERSFELNLIDDEVGAPISFNLVDAPWLKRIAKQLNWSMDAINTGWHRWVLGYSQERQRSLMQRLGLGFLKGYYLAVGMVVFTGVILLLIGLYLHRISRQERDVVQRAYLRFCQKLARRGTTRAVTEGPRDFARRARREWPEKRERIERISRLYIALRYGRVQSNGQIRELKRLVREFRL